MSIIKIRLNLDSLINYFKKELGISIRVFNKESNSLQLRDIKSFFYLVNLIPDVYLNTSILLNIFQLMLQLRYIQNC